MQAPPLSRAPVDTCFVGAGNLASAMVRGLTAGGAPADRIACLSGSGASARRLAAETGIQAFPAEAPPDAATWVIACKPHQLEELAPAVVGATADRLVVSVLAGVPLARLQAIFPRAANRVRAMPNTPSAIGRGVTGWSAATPLTHEQRLPVQALMDAMGLGLEVDESALDAVTAVSGSGAAYVFELARVWIDAGCRQGLSAEQARLLVLETLAGATALMQQDADADPADLRDRVTSRGGTTAAALAVFAEADLAQIFDRAIEAAARRARELGGS